MEPMFQRGTGSVFRSKRYSVTRSTIPTQSFSTAFDSSLKIQILGQSLNLSQMLSFHFRSGEWAKALGK
jgi:hypothetical protein